MKKQAGFTLIELIMVIVILGILSAFALPRFADLSGNAETAAVQGAFGSIKSASAIVRSSALVNGETDPVELEGLFIALVNGYAASALGGNGAETTPGGILMAAGISNSDFHIDETALRVIVAAQNEDNAACTIYTAATASAPPVIAFHDEGFTPVDGTTPATCQ